MVDLVRRYPISSDDAFAAPAAVPPETSFQLSCRDRSKRHQPARAMRQWRCLAS